MVGMGSPQDLYNNLPDARKIFSSTFYFPQSNRVLDLIMGHWQFPYSECRHLVSP